MYFVPTSSYLCSVYRDREALLYTRPVLYLFSQPLAEKKLLLPSNSLPVRSKVYSIIIIAGSYKQPSVTMDGVSPLVVSRSEFDGRLQAIVFHTFIL